MAKNRVHADGDQLKLAPTSAPGTTVASGDPVVIGQIPAVALETGSDTVGNGGKATVQMDGSFNLSVKGIDGGGNSAVAQGDIIYYVAADTPRLSKKATGVRFGYAIGTVPSAGTATIEVKLGY